MSVAGLWVLRLRVVRKFWSRIQRGIPGWKRVLRKFGSTIQSSAAGWKVILCWIEFGALFVKFLPLGGWGQRTWRQKAANLAAEGIEPRTSEGSELDVWGQRTWQQRAENVKLVCHFEHHSLAVITVEKLVHGILNISLYEWSYYQKIWNINVHLINYRSSL